jgi:hypothetical protein
LFIAASCWAGGPRYVTGPPFFTAAPGQPVGWKQPQLMYFTDPGELGSSVNHAASDALVAAAAGVWNVPVASITVGQGGQLAEHVSGQNVYLSNSGMVWPNDVMSTNAAAIPIAVVYDTDGSVTDLLKGSGASDPASCEQNAVTESVDAFDPAGYILHAIVVVNGRCSGPAAAQQLQLQYQLERVFGRVLGLAWSQTNDNVFTGSPQPTYNQANFWPILHPIDVLCGPYSYQCLPNPFTLRIDDVAALVSVYPNRNSATLAAGKQLSLANANPGSGTLTFPDGEGMSGVNVLMARETPYTTTPDAWYSVSAATGSAFRRSGLSPFVAAATSATGSMGTTSTGSRGAFSMPYLPMEDGAAFQNEVITTEPLNALYIGSLAVGPYGIGAVAPAGSSPVPFQWQANAGDGQSVNFTIADAPSVCGNGLDGTASLPAAAPASGWWDGLLCGYGHASYAALSVRAGRSLTVEVTALDENGNATTTKAMPVIGLFAPTDAAGSLPSLGVAASAFQSMEVGTTTLAAQPFAAGGAGGVVRVGIADERGEGRPDFTYQARIFYADSVTPAEVSVSSANATVTISGMGFRQGNEVLVNGVAAQVSSWTSTTIVAAVPSMAAAGATAGTGVDVEVVDLGTGATTTMTGALSYGVGTLPDNMLLVSAPIGPQFVGSVVATPFAVRMLGSDGATPLAGQAVVFSTAAGTAQFTACGAATCTVTTDANGMASVSVDPLQAVAITLQATALGLTQTATFSGEADGSVMKVLSTPPAMIPVGTVGSTGFAVQVVNAYNSGISGTVISFATTQGAANLGPCNAPVCSVVSNGSGLSTVTVTPTAVGPIAIQASDGNLTQSTTLTATSGTDILTLTQAPSAIVQVGVHTSIAVLLTLPDGVTGVRDVPVVFSGPPSVEFWACGSNPCTSYTDYWGNVATQITANAPGTATITVGYGALSVSATIQFVPATTAQLTLLSAPSGNVPVGTVAATPLKALLLNANGTPMAGAQVVLGGPLDAVTMGACGTGSCMMFTDANGTVTSTVTPTQAGSLSVEALWLGQVAQATFTAVGPGSSLTVVTPPPATVPVGSPVSFKLKGLAADGVTPLAGATAWATVTSGDLAIQGCAQTICKYYLAADGTVTITGTPWIAGLTSVSIDVNELVVNVSFTAIQPTEVMKVATAPSGTYAPGAAIAPVFSVQVLKADGVTPVSGDNVTFAVSNGSASFAACSLAPCAVKTNASGLASSGAIGVGAPGGVTLTATDNGMSATASYTVSGKPDVVTLGSAPASVLQGSIAAAPFTVQATLADGVTPASGVAVALQATGAGAATFQACGAASCTLTTNAKGIVTSSVTGTQAGAVKLQGTAQLSLGNQSVSANLTVVPVVQGVTISLAQVYVAENVAVPLNLTANVAQNGAAASGQTVAWAGFPLFSPGGASSVTDSFGNATAQVTLGPMAATVSDKATACAWTTVCAQFTGTAISAANWGIAIASGGNQNATGGAALAPVVAQVTDGNGHPLAGATVTVGQTVRAFDASCPAEGRCPAAPTLASGSSTLVSDIHGDVSVQPMTIAGTATTTSLAFSAGLNGFATAVVSSTQ